MEHSLPLISTLALAFGLALVFGYCVERLRIPAIVGYLLAGVAVGTHTPGLTADPVVASQLSEVGVMLLMFGVGLHFSLDDLAKVRAIAVTGAVSQMVISAATAGLFAFYFWDWTPSHALVFGLSLSCASTIVMIKGFEMRRQLNTMDGQISVGWLIVEDLVSVIILVLLSPIGIILDSLAGSGSAVQINWYHITFTVALTVLKVICFVFLMLQVGRRFVPWLLMQIAKTRSRELFTLSILSGAIGIAYGASLLFDVSFALGAFFAGMVMRESKFSRRAAKESLPLQDAFAVFFFLGVGMMLDPTVIVRSPEQVFTVLAIIMIFNAVVAFGVVRLLGYPLHTSLTVGAGVSQIGEFSFIIVSTAIGLKMADDNLMSIIVAASILSIAFNSFVFTTVPFVCRVLVRFFGWARAAAMVVDPYSALPNDTSRMLLAGQTIIVGGDATTKPLAERLMKQGIRAVLIVSDHAEAENLRSQNFAVIAGDSLDPMVLVQAHIVSARLIVITGHDPVTAHKTIDVCRQINPNLQFIVRSAHTEDKEQIAGDNVLEFFDDANALAGVVADRVHSFYHPDEDALIEEDSQAASLKTKSALKRAARRVNRRKAHEEIDERQQELL